jgi:hypothetical protein
MMDTTIARWPLAQLKVVTLRDRVYVDTLRHDAGLTPAT